MCANTTMGVLCFRCLTSSSSHSSCSCPSVPSPPAFKFITFTRPTKCTPFLSKLYHPPPLMTQKAPVPAHAMHFRKPRRSIPSWLWSCRSSSFFFSDILALHTYFFYAVSKLCTCRWGWRRGMVWGLPAPPLNVLASIQTEAAPLLFQILRVHVSLCMSVTTEPRRE